MGNAALQKLLPYMNRMEGNLQNRVNSLARDLEEVNEKVCNLTENQLAQICAKIDVIDSRLVSVSSAIKDTDLQEAEQNIVTNVTKETQKMSNSLHEVMEELEQNMLNTVRNELYDHVHEDLGEFERDVLSNVTTQLNDLADLHNHICGGTGGRRRVVYLDMTDPNTICPSGWQLTAHSKRTCGRVSTDHLTCDSVFFPVSGGAYTSVCGRIKGYQYGHPDAFYSYHVRQATTINSAYVDGVSLTHGTPRQHIWTFAASPFSTSTNIQACPCNSTTHTSAPPFVGQDYFCESGRNSGSTGQLYVDDPLWDGDSCAISSTCCPFNNPPYFTKRLSSAATDDIEVRLCQSDWHDDTPIELMELYVK